MGDGSLTGAFAPPFFMMKPSHYLKIFPLAERNDRSLLFSTKRCSLALPEKETVAQLRQGTVPGSQAELLSRLGMAVEDPDAERADVHGMLDELNRLHRNLQVSVILGMACNFACVYCYEGSRKGPAAMSDDTGSQLVRYLESRLTDTTQKLVLNFYGGETLLYRERIVFLAERLQPLIEARGGTLEMRLITNGSLLTPAIVEQLLPLGLTSAKICIDGPPDNHNQFRPFKDGRPSFDTVLANVLACCDLLPLNLVGNYTRDNYQRFPELLDLYLAAGITPERVRQVQFYPAMQVNDQYANPEFTSGCCSVAEPWLIEASLFLREELGRRGFPLAKMTPTPCMVDIDDAFAVNYDGSLYKCITMVGNPEYACGDIRQGMTDHRQRYAAAHWQGNVDCHDCEYLPLCFGGCRYMAFQRDGHMGNVDCQKEYLDATLAAMLRQELKYRYGQG